MRRLFYAFWLAAMTISSSHASTLFEATAGGFTNDIALNQVVNQNFASASDSQSAANSNFSSSASLSTGTLRIATSGTITGDDVSASAFASIGDTFSVNNTLGSGGTHLGANVHLSGTWTTTPALTNWSLFSIYFLNNGSFDQSNPTAPENVIASALYGIGPNASQPPFVTTPLSGFFTTFPSDIQVSLPVNVSSLPSTFEVLVVAQILLTSSGLPSASWNANLGNTITTTFVAPAGVTLTSAGGIPVASAVPEPASTSLAVLGLAVLAIRRRRLPR